MKKNFLFIFPISIGGRLTLKSIFDGFNSLGFSIDSFDEFLDNEDIFKSLITSEQYNYLVSYDYSAIKLKQNYKLNIKTINYFSDEINSTLSGSYWKEYYNSIQDKSNVIFYWDKQLTDKLNLDNVHYLPHFVNTNVYKNLNLKKEYDICFTGRINSIERQNLIRTLIKKYKNIALFSLEKHFKEFLTTVENEEEKDLLKNSYRGFISTEEEMANVLNKSKIVINIHSQGKTSLNYRSFQCMGCETLVLNDFREEGVSLFKDNFIFYNNIEDLMTKIDYFIENEEQYKLITKALRKDVEKNHSHLSGVKKIQEICKF